MILERSQRAGPKESGRWVRRLGLIALIALVVALVAFSYIPLKQTMSTGVDWLGFEFGQTIPAEHLFDPLDFCPSVSSNGLGRVSFVWWTVSGRPVTSFELTGTSLRMGPTPILYNSTNASSGGYSFDLTSSIGPTPCGVDYTMVMYSSSANPTTVSITIVYNYTAEVPLL